MDKYLYKVVVKLIVLIIIIVCSNYIYKQTLFEKDIQKHSPVINLVREIVKDSCEVVYIGESSNVTFRDDDIDKRRISDFISDFFPDVKLGTITKEASHAGIFYELLRNIPANSNVKTVIVTLNLRSFDAGWIYSNLETPLQKSIVLLKDNPPLVNRFLLAFGGYDIKTEKQRQMQFKRQWRNDILEFPYPFKYKNVPEWNKGLAKEGIINTDGTLNNDLTILACHYIKTYAFQIDTNTNPRIKDFDKIVKLAKDRNWNLVFNLLAENIDKADTLVGKDLVFLLKQNRELLIERYNKNGVHVVDNMENIRDIEFIDQDWTTEHYSETGRKIIAKNVAQYLKQKYPNQFVEANYETNRPSEFLNDCEGEIIWSQMQTLSPERSFRGSKSSKTGQNQEFGLTFAYAIKNLPDSLKRINVQFKLFQESITKDAKLIFELSGDSVSYQFNGVNITDITSNAINKWESVSYTFNLPNNFYNAAILKLYIYNPTNYLLYCDDIYIQFAK